MKIKQMLSQNRRDFAAMMICEHCGNEELNKYGYDDDNYHKNVIPTMKCKACGKAAPEDYEARVTKYKSYQVV